VIRKALAEDDLHNFRLKHKLHEFCWKRLKFHKVEVR
jgi:hypothetical protein